MHKSKKVASTVTKPTIISNKFPSFYVFIFTLGLIVMVNEYFYKIIELFVKPGVCSKAYQIGA